MQDNDKAMDIYMNSRFTHDLKMVYQNMQLTS